MWDKLVLFYRGIFERSVNEYKRSTLSNPKIWNGKKSNNQGSDNNMLDK